jgi:hypothetical protein
VAIIRHNTAKNGRTGTRTMKPRHKRTYSTETKYNKHFISQDLDNFIYEIILKIKNKTFTFYGVSLAEAEANALDFIEQIYFNSDVVEQWNATEQEQ